MPAPAPAPAPAPVQAPAPAPAGSAAARRVHWANESNGQSLIQEGDIDESPLGGGHKVLLATMGIDDIDEYIIEFRKKIIKTLNETLGNIGFYVLYIQEFIQYLYKIKNKSKLTKLQRERLLNNFRIKYGIDGALLTSNIITRLLSSKTYSILKLKNHIIKETTKIVKNFDFDKFIEHYYPMSGRAFTKNIVEFVMNESEIVQEKLDKLMGNSSRNIVHIKSLKENKYEIRDIGIWVPAVVNAPIRVKGFGFKKKIKKKLVLYNLFTGQIIPCLTRSKFTKVSKKPKDDWVSCMNFEKIKDQNDLIQYTITKSNFNGIIVLGSSLKSNNKYMQLFANKLEHMDGKIVINLNDYLKLENAKLKQWVSSNLELFLDNYVENKEYESSNKKFVMPVAVNFGEGIIKKKLTFGSKKFLTIKDTSDWDETTKNSSSIKLTLESWASKGSPSIIKGLQKNKSTGLYGNYRKSLKNGYQGVTGKVVKNMLTVLYKDYTQNREFKLSDYDRLMTFIRMDQSGGMRINKLYKNKLTYEKELKTVITNMEIEIEKHINMNQFSNYYKYLSHLFSK